MIKYHYYLTQYLGRAFISKMVIKTR